MVETYGENATFKLSHVLCQSEYSSSLIYRSEKKKEVKCYYKYRVN